MSAVPDFTQLDLGEVGQTGPTPDLGTFTTPEGIDVRALTTSADLDGLDCRLDRAEVAPTSGHRQREEENDSCQSSTAR